MDATGRAEFEARIDQAAGLAAEKAVREALAGENARASAEYVSDARFDGQHWSFPGMVACDGCGEPHGPRRLTAGHCRLCHIRVFGTDPGTR